ncbi:hypothetical protein BKA61DRAFT_682242 [Leptodontidium sp. MPI-SDFR-AT-0119]|nr:hypothetical protein BKA61DRAFT_682242 [Leptodontidium sp. MPI-SDFR-AT-0119]
MASTNPTPPRRRRPVKRVSFAQVYYDETEDYPRRVYPPTPIRLPRHEFEDMYPNWKKCLTALLILGCISLGLGADYAIVKDDQTPVVCYLSSWVGLDKCSAGKDATVSIEWGLPAGGVFEEWMKFRYYLFKLPDIVERLYKAQHILDVNGHALAVVVEELDRCHNGEIAQTSKIHQLGKDTEAFHSMLGNGGVGWSADRILSKTQDMLVLVKDLMRNYNFLAHPNGKSLEMDQLKVLKDPNYWRTQYELQFGGQWNIDTTALAAYFSGLFEVESVLEDAKESQEALVSVLHHLDKEITENRPLVVGGKMSQAVLERWISSLDHIIADLEPIIERLDSVGKEAFKRKIRHGEAKLRKEKGKWKWF